VSSIHEIAKRAGVSITTVSRALNNYSDISPATKQMILDLCEELDYHPNPAAKSLASKKSNVIALILSDIKETDSNGNIIYRLLLGAQATCAEQGYELIIIFSNAQKQQKKSLKILSKERNVCGFIIYGLKMTDPYYDEIAISNIPCVTIDVDTSGGRHAVVCTNNVEAVEQVVDFLYKKGHRHIAMMNGSKEAFISHIREKGFRNAMRRYNLEIMNGTICYADYFEAKAYQMAKVLLKEHNEITAVFAGSDIMAMGVLRAVHELGKKTPRDIAVVGFDGIQVGEYTQPPLTTVCQNFKLMGSSAADKVINMIEGKPYNHVDFVPHELIIRHSV
jgi:DNA-binding LacI/PurR family transcriptional regulator